MRAGGRRTGIAECVRRSRGNKNEIAGSAVQSALATAQIDLAFEDVKNLLYLGMVMCAGVESRRDRELEYRALLGVLGREQIIDPGLM